jgi:PhoD-like phosphatase
MPTPDVPTYPLYATTPTLGVRVWIEAGKVCLHVGSEGGRGVPKKLVLMPVRTIEPGRVEPLPDLPAIYADPAVRAQFRKSHYRSPPSTLFSPFTERFSAHEWSALTLEGPLQLAILLFRQADTSEVANKAPADAYNDGADWQSELEALLALFAKPRPAAWLRRGLVWVDPSDVPAGAAEYAPAEPASPMTFALASCQYPAGLLDGTPQEFGSAPPGPADASMLRLAARLAPKDASARPSLLVLCGDQIYADATAGLFDPRARPNPGVLNPERMDEDWLRVPYQNWLGSVGAQSVLGRIRTFMQLDDHEIRDNWEPIPLPPPEKAANDALRKAGLESYGRYQRNRPGSNPLPRAWQILAHRGIAFFLADTRTERQARKASLEPEAPRIMFPEQAAALNRWLTDTIGHPAFVVSPSMLLPRRRLSARQPRSALHSDAWDGYPGSLHALLAAVWRTERSDLVFLSGDEHLSCIAHVTVSNLVIDVAQTRSVTLHSVHSSGLYAPWPFANSVPELFAETDDWCFNDPDDLNDPPTRLRCQVKVLEWVPGDGFACLSLQRGDAGDWNVTVAFDRAHAAPKPRTLQLSNQPVPITSRSARAST